MAKNIKKIQTIDIKPLGTEYLEYIKNSISAKINVLEGAIRSGKTIVNLLAFSSYIDNHPQGGLFVASGITSGVAWEILAECRGLTCNYGLMYIFKGRCKKTKVKGSDALEITNKLGKICTILFVGGKNKGCIEFVRGFTIQGWIATELENHSTDEGNDFIGFMFGRMIGARNAKMFFDLNPSYPTNKMYSNYLDKFEEILGVKYNYLHCNMYMNKGLTDEQIKDTLALYTDTESVMYKRDILGLRACASGLIFKQFANDTKKFLIDDVNSYIKDHKNVFISIGMDFGGNKSKTTYVASIIYELKGIVVIFDHELDMSDATLGDMQDHLEDFINYLRWVYPNIPIKYLYFDSADPVTGRCMGLIAKKYGILTQGAKKLSIKERIDMKQMLLSKGVFKVYNKCEFVIDSLSTQVYNNKEGHEDERLDDGTCDIDITDAEEYSWSAFGQKMISNISRR